MSDFVVKSNIVVRSYMGSVISIIFSNAKGAHLRKCMGSCRNQQKVFSFEIAGIMQRLCDL